MLVGTTHLIKLLAGVSDQKFLPAENTILLLSGRISFELVQKALLAGIPNLVGIGAPSSLAIELAEEFDLTLLGFLRENSVNVYAGEWRVDRLQLNNQNLIRSSSCYCQRLTLRERGYLQEPTQSKVARLFLDGRNFD